MTKEQLDQFERWVQGESYIPDCIESYDELIRLARLGMESEGLCTMEVAEKARLIALGIWAEEKGIQAIKVFVNSPAEYGTKENYDQIRALEKAIEALPEKK